MRQGNVLSISEHCRTVDNVRTHLLLSALIARSLDNRVPSSVISPFIIPSLLYAARTTIQSCNGSISFAIPMAWSGCSVVGGRAESASPAAGPKYNDTSTTAAQPFHAGRNASLRKQGSERGLSVGNTTLDVMDWPLG